MMQVGGESEGDGVEHVVVVLDAFSPLVHDSPRPPGSQGPLGGRIMNAI